MGQIARRVLTSGLFIFTVTQVLLFGAMFLVGAMTLNVKSIAIIFAVSPLISALGFGMDLRDVALLRALAWSALFAVVITSTQALVAYEASPRNKKFEDPIEFIMPTLFFAMQIGMAMIGRHQARNPRPGLNGS